MISLSFHRPPFFLLSFCIYHHQSRPLSVRCQRYVYHFRFLTRLLFLLESSHCTVKNNLVRKLILAVLLFLFLCINLFLIRMYAVCFQKRLWIIWISSTSRSSFLPFQGVIWVDKSRILVAIHFSFFFFFFVFDFFYC